MERFSKGHLKLLEESLQAQIAEFKSDFSDKDIRPSKIDYWFIILQGRKSLGWAGAFYFYFVHTEMYYC